MMAMRVDLPAGYGLRALRFRLLDRRAELERERNLHLNAARAASAGPGDSAAVVAQEREIDYAEAERDARELAAIDRALERMDRGEYGRCVDCGAGIGYPRLAANPHALRCVACESAQEAAGRA